ncbi:MAG: hypothetical protein ACYC1U_09690 [Candidatus Aquicultorales bacterium]
MTRRTKLFATGLAIVMAVLLLPLFAAYEALVINVTAHIENALHVSTTRIPFGIVFPQESLVETFSVSLSDSFLQQDRVTDVHYQIVQRTKPWTPDSVEPKPNVGTQMEGQYYDLRPYVSKTKLPDGDTLPDTEDAASLNQTSGDLYDVWRVRLPVPCIQGAVGQDYVGPIAPAEGDYGLDIWIEVYGLSYDGVKNDIVIDANGWSHPGNGVPAGMEVTPGDPLASFGTSNIWVIDRDGSGGWSANDDMFVDANGNGAYDVGERVILDVNGGMTAGDAGTFNVDTTPGLKFKFHDTNGNGVWDNGEDIILDGNNDGTYS